MKRFSWILVIGIILASCSSNGIGKILKNPDPAYKLRMAEQFFVKKKWSLAQQLYEDVMPYYKASKEFEDIYYKYAYCAYNMGDYMNAENLFKSYLEIFPNSTRAEEVDFMRAYSFYKQSPKPELDQTNTMRAMGMMQTKDFQSAQLYYDMQQYRAAAVAFSALLNSYPESMKADEYKLMIIKSYYNFAEMSIEEKKIERYEQVITECNEFEDRFPDSKLKKEVEDYMHTSQNKIKILSNEQVKTSA